MAARTAPSTSATTDQNETCETVSAAACAVWRACSAACWRVVPVGGLELGEPLLGLLARDAGLLRDHVEGRVAILRRGAVLDAAHHALDRIQHAAAAGGLLGLLDLLLHLPGRRGGTVEQTLGLAANVVGQDLHGGRGQRLRALAHGLGRTAERAEGAADQAADRGGEQVDREQGRDRPGHHAVQHAVRARRHAGQPARHPRAEEYRYGGGADPPHAAAEAERGRLRRVGHGRVDGGGADGEAQEHQRHLDDEDDDHAGEMAPQEIRRTAGGRRSSA